MVHFVKLSFCVTALLLSSTMGTLAVDCPPPPLPSEMTRDQLNACLVEISKLRDDLKKLQSRSIVIKRKRYPQFDQWFEVRKNKGQNDFKLEKHALCSITAMHVGGATGIGGGESLCQLDVDASGEWRAK